jgi:hypothetical protein
MSNNDLTLSLIDDPFFLHTFLEEYISANIGNNSFSSFNNFINFCPSLYSGILKDSSEYVNRIKNLFESLFRVDIKLEKRKKNYYDSDDDDYYASIIANYDISNEMTSDTYDKLLNSKYSEELSILSKEIFINHKHDDENRGKMDRYSNSSIKVDRNVEEKMYGILNNIITDIVSKSKNQDIFIPVGYSNYNENGHLIGMIVSRSYINIFNGGDGVQYHSMGSDSNSLSIRKDQPRYPQCSVKLSRPTDKKLERLLTSLIILSRTYSNTTINHIYSELFSVYIDQQINLSINNSFINSTLINLVKKIMKEDMTSSVIKHTKITKSKKLQKKFNDNAYDNSYSREKEEKNKHVFTNAEEPVLKHTNYYKKRCYRMLYSDNINDLIMDKISNIFTESTIKQIITNNRYNDDFELKDVVSVVTKSFNDIKRLVESHMRENIIRTTSVTIIERPIDKKNKYNKKNRGDENVINSIIILVMRHIMKYISTYKTYDNLTIEPEFYVKIHNFYNGDGKNGNDIFSLYVSLILDNIVKDDKYEHFIDNEYVKIRDEYNKIDSDSNVYDHEMYDIYFKKREQIKEEILKQHTSDDGVLYVASMYFPFSINMENIFESLKLGNIFTENYLTTKFDEKSSDNIIADFKNILIENIVGVECSDPVSEPHQIFTDILMNRLIYRGGKNVREYELCFEIDGKNIMRQNDLLVNYDDLEETEDVNSWIGMIINRFDIYKQIITNPILLSTDPKRGYMREQYSGSCAYNGILLAIHSSINYSYRNNDYITPDDIRYYTGINILNDKLSLIDKGTLKLKHEDSVVINTIEKNLTDQLENVLEHLKNHPESLRINYPESLTKDIIDKKKKKNIKRKYRKKQVSLYLESIHTKHNQMISLIKLLKDHIPLRQYPTIKLVESDESTDNTRTMKNNTTKNNTMKKNESYEFLASNLKSVSDIGKMINDIIDNNKNNGKKYTEIIMAKIIDLTRSFASDAKLDINRKIDIVYDVYANVITHIENESTKEYKYSARSEKTFMWVDITLLYILLFCLDHLLFINYKGSDPQSNEKYRYYDKIENNLLRNLYLTGNLSDPNINHLIHMLQRYEMFYPINDTSYYLEMIRSIRRSGITELVSDKLNVKIDLMNNNIDRINSAIIEISGIQHINKLITINFGTSIESYSKNKGLKNINVVDYEGTNEKLSELVENIIKNKHTSTYISSYDEVIDKYVGQEQDKPSYFEMSLLKEVWNVRNNDNIWKLEVNDQKLILFYFTLQPSINRDEFTFDIKFDDKVTRIKPKSNVIILNMDKYISDKSQEYSYGRYRYLNFNILSQYPIDNINVFELNHKNDDFIKLFNSTHTEYVINYYVARPLEYHNTNKIIDIENIHKTITDGDLQNAIEKLDKNMIYVRQSEYSTQYNMLYYSLFPHSKHYDHPILPIMNSYVINGGVTGKAIVYHNLFDITDYLNYYRSIMKKMFADPLIIALYNDQSSESKTDNHKQKVCSKLEQLADILGLEQTISIDYNDIIDIKSNDEPILNIMIESGRSSDDTFEFNIRGNYGKDAKGIMIDNFEILESPSRIENIQNMFRKSNDTKSLNALNNTIKIALEIDKSFLGIKLDNNKLIKVRIFVVFNDMIINNMTYMAESFPWNKLSESNTDKHSQNRIPLPESSYYNKNRNVTYVTYNTYQFESIIPEVNLTDDSDCVMFLEFCSFLLANQSYAILNMYLPIIVSIYHTQRVPYATKFVDFIMKKKYFNSPYNYYMLNKLHFMIYGEFNSNLVYNLSKRQSYYPKIYTNIDPNTKLTEYKIQDELYIYYEWLRMIKPYVDFNINTKTIDKTVANPIDSKIITIDILKSIVTFLDKIVLSNNLVYKNVTIEDVLNFGDPIRYLMDESNYRSLFCNIQLDILSKIRSIAFDDKIKDDIEIIGNIKYFINDTFDHNNDKLISSDVDTIDGPIKLFELTTGKIVDFIQHAFIQNMINDDTQSQYNVYELLMGRGKSYVIIPCIMLTYYYNQKYQNVIQCMPSHLITQSSKVLSKFLPFMTTGYIYNLQVDRHVNTNSYGNKKQKKRNFSLITQSSVSKIIITDDINIKTELLVRVENELNNNGNKSGGGYIELHYNQNDIDEITDPIIASLESNRKTNNESESFKIKDRYLADKSIIAIDEFDMLIDPLKSDLNFPTGNYSNIDHQDVLIRIVLNITQELFKKYHSYMMRSDRTDERINKLIIRKIVLEMDTMIYTDLKGLIRNVYKKFRQYQKSNRQTASKELPELFKQFTKDENLDIKKYKKNNVVSGLSGGGFDDLLLYYVRETHKIYQNAMSMLLDKDYGWDDTDPKNPYIAIPYSAQDTPMKGSQFSDIIINIILTSITYCQKGLRMLDINQFIKYIKFSSKRWGIHQVKSFLKIDQKLIEFAMIESEKGFYNYMQYLYNNDYPSYVDAICIYLEKIILIQYVKMDPEIMNTSFIDVIDPNFIKAKFAVSGTTNVHLPKFKYYGQQNVLNRVIKDTITHRNIQMAMRGDNLGTYITGKSNVLVINSDARTDSILNLMKNYQILIDTGSFLRYDSNFSIGSKLSEMYNDYYIIYFDANDNPKVLLNNNHVDYNISNLKYENLYKVYYDQKHTVGTDLDLPSAAKCIITVHKFNTHTEIVQGLFRLREINYYQHHDYLIKNDTDLQLNNMSKSSINNKLENLIKFLQDNENKKHENAKFKYLQQYTLCLYRTLYDYNPNSYLIKVFVPSEETIDITIMKNYDYNFAKIHFMNMMNNKIKLHAPNQTLNKTPKKSKSKTGNKTTQKFIHTQIQHQHQLETDHKTKLFKELSDTIQTINNFNRDVSTTMIQKQSENVKNVNMEISYERNYRYQDNNNTKITMDNITYGDFITKLGCINMITNTPIQFCKDPIINMNIFDERYEDVPSKDNDNYDNYDNYNKQRIKKWVERKVPLIEYVQSLGVSISPDALQTIYLLFNKEETEQFYKCYNKTTKITTLLTSYDVVFIKVRYYKIIELLDIKPIVEFNNDPINNLLLMLKFEIPMDDVVDTIRSNDLIDSHREIIFDYYNKYFAYKLLSVSPVFYKFLTNGLSLENSHEY